VRRVLCSLLLTAFVAHASADQLPQELADGIDAYTNVDYQQALTYLRAALRTVKGRKKLALAYFYLGCTYLALEELERARAAFETLLSFQPDYVPSRQLTSPKIASFLDRVRREYPTPKAPPSLAHRPPDRLSRDTTELVLEVQHLAPRLRPILRYRASTSPGFLSVEASEVLGARATFVVPTPADEGLVYYFQLQTRSGIAVRRLGSPERPFRVRAQGRGGRRRDRDDEAAPFYKRWWFWTVAGVVVTGAAVGLAVGLTRGSGDVEARVTILRRDASGKTIPVFAP
jgi:tetratricopeptide (TPR) repeat protein